MTGQASNCRRATMLEAKREAAPLKLADVFDDSLAGDLARLRVRRRLMRALPEDTADVRETMIQELLTP